MAVLTTKERKDMPKSEFGVPGERRFPMPDKNHARNALARLNQAKGLTEEQKVHIMRKAHAMLGEKNK